MSETPARYNKWYRGEKLDPYRIARIYGITHPAQFHALKKILRWHDTDNRKKEATDIMACVERLKEMDREENGEVRDSKKDERHDPPAGLQPGWMLRRSTELIFHGDLYWNPVLECWLPVAPTFVGRLVDDRIIATKHIPQT